MYFNTICIPDDSLSDEKQGTSNDTEVFFDYQCHETLEDYESVMESAQFWLEGVALLVVGLFGMAGNVLTIVVLRRIDSNTTFSFNRLLMTLGKFDLFLV